MNPHRNEVVEFFNSKLNWTKVYGDNLPKGFFSFEMNRRKEMVIETVTTCLAGRKGLKILECGCGPGGILRDLPLPDHQVFGIDINDNYLGAMRDSCPHVGVICCDLEALPFGDNLFDVVICVGVLPYLRNDERAIEEMARMLKPGGVLIVSNPSYFMIDKFFDPYYFVAWPARQFGRLLQRLSGGPGVGAAGFSSDRIRRYRFSQLDPLYVRHGFAKVYDRPVSFGPIRFWKKEYLDIDRSIRMSERLVKLAGKRSCRFLQRIANHRVTCLLKSNEASHEQATLLH